MWRNNQAKFIYFYFQKYRVINNDWSSGLFERPFDVDPDSKVDWAASGKSKQLAPELITYWKDE